MKAEPSRFSKDLEGLIPPILAANLEFLISRMAVLSSLKAVTIKYLNNEMLLSPKDVKTQCVT